MLRVGLTGGVAAGKSTVAALLAARGAAVRDADAIVAGLYAPGGGAVEPLVELFGREILEPGAGVERNRLASRLANEPQLLRQLEQIVHPLVVEELERWLAALEREGSVPVAVVEAALLVETGTFQRFHRLVVVTAPEAVRRERALASGFSARLLEQILAQQADDAARLRVASYVVENAGTPEELERSVARLWEALMRDAQLQASGLPLPEVSALRL